MYDVIVPLGMNCCVAFQLRHRGLRTNAFPFDWVLMKDEESVRRLASGFRDGFATLALKENLEPAIDPYWHPDSRYDREYHCYFLHHFKGDSNVPGVYETMYAKLRRRIDHLFQSLSKARNALVVMGLLKPIPLSALEELKTALKSVFPSTNFTFRFVQFRANEADGLSDQSEEFIAVNRAQSDYDMNLTSAEWSFLDRIAKPRCKLSRFEKLVRKLYKWSKKKLSVRGIGSMRDLV